MESGKMNVPKFQFCLNHDDPAIVKLGLTSFTNQILAEHKAISSFGYNSRPETLSTEETLFVTPINQATGLLAAYISSSPRAAEFFVLWSLSQREADPELCYAQTQCAAAIIHCASISCASYVATFITQLLNEFSSSILKQLSSDNLALVHASIGLLISICRSSRNFAISVLDSMVLTRITNAKSESETALTPGIVNCLKPGKSMKWKCKGRGDDQPKMFLDTDSRFMAGYLALVIVMKLDETVSISDSVGAAALREDLFGNNALLRKFIVGLPKDQLSTIRLVLEGLMFLEKRSKAIGGSWSTLSLLVVDYSVIPKMIMIFKHQNANAQLCAKNFIRNYISMLHEGNSSHRGLANNLLRQLQSHIDLLHRELAVEILHSFPNLLSKALSFIPINWSEIDASAEYVGGLSQIIYFLNKAEVPSTLVTSCVDLIKSVVDGSALTGGAKETIDELMSYVMPAGLTKKEIIKILQHSDRDLQRLGIMLVEGILKKVGGILGLDTNNVESRRDRPLLKGVIQMVLMKYIPDFAVISAVWTRSLKLVTKDLTDDSSNILSEGDIAPTAYDENIGCCLDVVLLLKTYVSVLPASIGQFEFNRLLDDIIKVLPISGTDNSGTWMTTIDGPKSSLLLTSILELILLATIQGKCKWFGTKEEAVKLLTNVIVNASWQESYKIGSLLKLIAIAYSTHCAIADDGDLCIENVRSIAQKLLLNILDQSNLFHASTWVQLALKSEQMQWLQLIRGGVMVHAVIFDLILRLAYNWNVEYCILPNTTRSVSDGSPPCSTLDFQIINCDSETLVPISPVLTVLVSLSFGDLDILAHSIPNNIKSRLVTVPLHHSKFVQMIPVDDVFFTKFFEGALVAVRDLVRHIIPVIYMVTPRPASFILPIERFCTFYFEARNADRPSTGEMSRSSDVWVHEIMSDVQALKYFNASTAPSAVLGQPNGNPVGKKSKKSQPIERSLYCDFDQFWCNAMAGLGRSSTVQSALSQQDEVRPRKKAAKEKSAHVLGPEKAKVTSLFTVDKFITLVPQFPAEYSQFITANSEFGTMPENAVRLAMSRVWKNTSIALSFATLLLRVSLATSHTTGIDAKILICVVDWSHDICSQLLSDFENNLDDGCIDIVHTFSLARMIELVMAVDVIRDSGAYDDLRTKCQMVFGLISQFVLSCSRRSMFSELFASAMIDSLTEQELTAALNSSAACTESGALPSNFSTCITGVITQCMFDFAELVDSGKKCKIQSAESAEPECICTFWGRIAGVLLRIDTEYLAKPVVQEFIAKIGLTMLYFYDDGSLNKRVIKWATSLPRQHALFDNDYEKKRTAIISEQSVDFGVEVNMANTTAALLLRSGDSVTRSTSIRSLLVEYFRVDAGSQLDLFLHSSLFSTCFTVNNRKVIDSLIDPLVGIDVVEIWKSVLKFPSILSEEDIFRVAPALASLSQFHSCLRLSLVHVVASCSLEEVLPQYCRPSLPHALHSLCKNGLAWVDDYSQNSSRLTRLLQSNWYILKKPNYLLTKASKSKHSSRQLNQADKKWKTTLEFCISATRAISSQRSAHWNLLGLCVEESGRRKLGRSKDAVMTSLLDLLERLISVEKISTNILSNELSNIVAIGVQNSAHGMIDDYICLTVPFLVLSRICEWLHEISVEEATCSGLDGVQDSCCSLYMSLLTLIVDANALLLPVLELGDDPVARDNVMMLNALLVLLLTGKCIDSALSAKVRLVFSNDVLHLRVNKWVKSSLKFGLTDRHLLISLRTCLCSLYDADASGSIWSLVLNDEMEGDCFRTGTVLGMIVGHSKFADVLKTAITDNSKNCRISLLLLLLSLCSRLSPQMATDADLKETCEYLSVELLNVYTGTLSHGDRAILRIFKHLSNLGLGKPICLLQLTTAAGHSSKTETPTGQLQTNSWLFQAVKTAAVFSTAAGFPVSRQVIPIAMHIEGDKCIAQYRDEMRDLQSKLSARWEISTTEGKASFAQSNKPGSVDDKSSESSEDFSDMSTVPEIEQAVAEDGHDEGDGEQSDNDIESELTSQADENVFNNQDHRGNKTLFRMYPQLCNVDDTSTGYVSNSESGTILDVDFGVHSQPTIYDPSFWIPSILQTLSDCPSLSVRLMARTGVLSLVFLALSSDCSVIRTYALCILEICWTNLHIQNVDVDPAFRERPQYLLLFRFLRNAIPLPMIGGNDKHDSSQRGPTKLATSMAIFLARSSIVIQQPTHELFGRVNKYLLSRPFVDVKDFPLFDLLFSEVLEPQTSSYGPGINPTPQTPALPTSNDCINALRMIRDGLGGRIDHLNLCRKNCYNRLMLLFPLFGKDTRLGNAILDVIDKALSLRDSARYLLERCDVTGWLTSMASLVGAFKLTSKLSVESSGEANSERISGELLLKHSGVDSNGQLVASPIFIVRIIKLLRRTCGAVTLQLVEHGRALSITSVLISVANSVVDAVRFLVDEVILVHNAGQTVLIPPEYLRMTIFLMWDVALLTSVLLASEKDWLSVGCASATRGWDESTLVGVIQVIFTHPKMLSSGFPQQPTAEGNELVSSVLALGSFINSKMDTSFTPHFEASSSALHSVLFSSTMLEHFLLLPTGAIYRCGSGGALMTVSAVPMNNMALSPTAPKLAKFGSAKHRNSTVSDSPYEMDWTGTCRHGFLPLLQVINRICTRGNRSDESPKASESARRVNTALWCEFANTDIAATLPAINKGSVISWLSLSILSVLRRRRSFSDGHSSDNLGAARWCLTVLSFVTNHFAKGDSSICNDVTLKTISNLSDWFVVDRQLIGSAKSVDGANSLTEGDAFISFQLRIRLLVATLTAILNSSDLKAWLVTNRPVLQILVNTLLVTLQVPRHATVFLDVAVDSPADLCEKAFKAAEEIQESDATAYDIFSCRNLWNNDCSSETLSTTTAVVEISNIVVDVCRCIVSEHDLKSTSPATFIPLATERVTELLRPISCAIMASTSTTLGDAAAQLGLPFSQVRKGLTMHDDDATSLAIPVVALPELAGILTDRRITSAWRRGDRRASEMLREAMSTAAGVSNTVISNSSNGRQTFIDASELGIADKGEDEILATSSGDQHVEAEKPDASARAVKSKRSLTSESSGSFSQKKLRRSIKAK